MNKHGFPRPESNSMFKSKIKEILILFLVLIIPILFNTGCGSCGTDYKDATTTDTQVDEDSGEIIGTVPHEYIIKIIQRSDVASLIEANSLILRTDFESANIVSPVPTPVSDMVSLALKPANGFFKFDESDNDEIAIVTCATSIDAEQQNCVLLDEEYGFSLPVPYDTELIIGFYVLLKSDANVSSIMKISSNFKNVDEETSTSTGVLMKVFALNKNVITSKDEVDIGVLACTSNTCETTNTSNTSTLTYISDSYWELLDTTFVDGASLKRTRSDLVRINNNIYMLGGHRSGDVGNAIDDVVMCDMSNDSPVCSVAENMTLPVAGCASAVAINQVIYIVTEDKNYSGFYALYKYDLSIGSGASWQRISQIPQDAGDRNCPKLTTMNNIIYLLGGFRETGYENGYKISTFDPESEKWQDFENKVEINTGFCTAIAKNENGDDKIYLIGGYQDQNIGQLSESIKVIDPLTNKVEEYSDILPILVAECNCATLNNKIYYSGLPFLNSSNQYQPETSIAGIFDPVAKTAISIDNTSFLFSMQMVTEIDNYLYLVGGVTAEKPLTYLDTIIKYYPDPE